MNDSHGEDPFQYIRANVAKYKSLLSAEYLTADTGKKADEQLRKMNSDEHVRTISEIRIPDTGARADMVYAGRPVNEPEELLVRLQGYVYRCSLPPILYPYQLPRKVRQATQSVALSGLGLDKFEEGVKAVLQIYNHFCRNLPQGCMDPWEPQITDGHLTLTFANRYLSSLHESEGMEQVPLSNDIDPNGLIRKAVPKIYHTSDNQVMYFERVPSGDNRATYRIIKPEGIRTGYMVEVQVGFCAVPISNHKYKFLLKLRSICVLNRQVDTDKNDAWIERAKAASSAHSNPLKRSVGYGSDSDADGDVNMQNAKRPKTTEEGLADDVENITIRQ